MIPTKTFFRLPVLGVALGVLLIGSSILQAKHKHTEESAPAGDEVSKLLVDADALSEKGSYAEALPLYQKALETRLQAQGEENADTAVALNSLASLYKKIGEPAKALPLYERALRIREKILGPDDLETAQSLNNMAVIYTDMGDWIKAVPLMERVLAIKDKAIGRNNRDWLASLRNLAWVSCRGGDYATALKLYEQALKVSEKINGPLSPETAVILTNLGVVYNRMGSASKAIPLYLSALQIRTQSLGKDHPETAEADHNLAMLYTAFNDYDKALPLHHDALTVFEQSLGPEHPYTARCLAGLGHLYKVMGDYNSAFPLYTRALDIQTKSYGPEHAVTLTTMNNLGSVYEGLGEYAKAETLLEKALEIRKKTIGSDKAETAGVEDNLAVVYSRMGNLNKAVPMEELALKTFESTLGTDNPRVANSLTHLAKMEAQMGDYEKARTFAERSLAISEKTFGSSHPETADALVSLADLEAGCGEYGKAAESYERALAIREKELGTDHVETADILNNLGEVETRAGRFDKASDHLQRALEIREKTLGPEHPDTATTFQNLGTLDLLSGKRDKAQQMFAQALDIREKALGPQHMDTAETLTSLASLLYLTGDVSGAKAMASRAANARDRQLEGALGLDERARLAWQAKNMIFTVEPCVLPPGELGNYILRWKGAVLDSLLEDASVSTSSAVDDAGREKIAEMSRLRDRLGLIAFNSDDASKTEVSQINARIAEIQRSLAGEAFAGGRERQAAAVSVDDITPVIPKGSALVEFIQFRDPKLPVVSARCYGAMILNAEGKPSFVRMNDAALIDSAVTALRSSIVQNDQKGFDRSQKILVEKLWKPLKAALPPGTSSLVISPDGGLNFLSFAALQDEDGSFIAEHFPVSYVGSGRDLARPALPGGGKEMVIFANPKFANGASSGGGVSPIAMRSVDMRAFSSVSLPQLPGTVEEAKRIQNDAVSAGWTATVHSGEDATKSEIRKVSKPGILHLATHGFYLNSTDPAAGNSRGLTVAQAHEDHPRDDQNQLDVDPMQASGIALAGAEDTVHAWAAGQTPPGESDGIMTANDVAGLDLRGTWLVALSACESGLGQARLGEGVMGLRRSFMTAGARNLLMTLWPISDETTAPIMDAFYKKVLSSGNAPDALAKVQKEWLVKLRSEKGALCAVRDAGPFVIATMAAQGSVPSSGSALAPAGGSLGFAR
jgi:tetratricopeptide (TPR) repeat protein/CHAT domain-containing protein